MKFSEMPYARPDLDAVKQQFADLLARFKAAATYAEAHAVFLEEEKLNKHVDTLAQLASDALHHIYYFLFFIYYLCTG